MLDCPSAVPEPTHATKQPWSMTHEGQVRDHRALDPHHRSLGPRIPQLRSPPSKLSWPAIGSSQAGSRYGPTPADVKIDPRPTNLLSPPTSLWMRDRVLSIPTTQGSLPSHSSFGSRHPRLPIQLPVLHGPASRLTNRVTQASGSNQSRQRPQISCKTSHFRDPSRPHPRRDPPHSTA
jgi:hypothetical protein